MGVKPSALRWCSFTVKDDARLLLHAPIKFRFKSSAQCLLLAVNTRSFVKKYAFSKTSSLHSQKNIICKFFDNIVVFAQKLSVQLVPGHGVEQSRD